MKTDLGRFYNEDDFVQVGKDLNELTVTITLCEYRNLILGQSNAEHKIEKLNSEIEELKKANKSMTDVIISQNPNFFSDIANGINKLFKKEGEKDEINDEEN